MATENWKKWEAFIGKKVKLVFDDGSKISIRNAVLKGYNENFLFLEGGEQGDEGVAISKIIRIEFSEEEK